MIRAGPGEPLPRRPPKSSCRPKANGRPRSWRAKTATEPSPTPPSTKAATPACCWPPRGARAEQAVIHWDGSSWSREPVQIPAGSETDFRILAIDATGLGNAWAIAAADPALGGPSSSCSAPRPAKVRSGSSAASARPSSPTRDAGRRHRRPGAARRRRAAVDGHRRRGLGRPRRHDRRCPARRRRSTTTSRRRRQRLLVRRGALLGAAGSQALAPARLSQLRLGRLGLWHAGDHQPARRGGGEDTNRGTYLRFEAGQFARKPGGGGNFRSSGAFSSVDDGWLQGPVEIAAKQPPSNLRQWPLTLRAPLTAVTSAPGAAPGALGSGALAVGVDGAVARYVPGRGWQREYLTSSSGAVSKVTLRGVAWPEPTHAYAVGDLGAMWGGTPTTASGSPTRGCRSAFRATCSGSPSIRPTRAAATRSARAACCSASARAGNPNRCRPASPRPTSPRSPSPAARRSSPPAATCWSTTAAAGRSTPPPTPCSRGCAPATRRSTPSPDCPTGERSRPGATSCSSATAGRAPPGASRGSRFPARPRSPPRRSAPVPACRR